MKKNVICYLSLIFTFNTYGMATKTRQVAPRRVFKPQTTVYATQPYRQPMIIDRLAQYYNQVKNQFYQFWYGEKYKQMIQNEKTALLQTIQSKKAGMGKAFHTFLQKQDQETVNKFLSDLIFSKQELEFLDTYLFAIQIKIINKTIDAVDKKNVYKIITWAKENIVQIFKQDFTITKDFFLITLLDIDYSLDLELISVIHDNLDLIQNKASGQKFLELLQSEHKNVYKAIIRREQRLKGMVKENVKQSIKGLNFRE